MNKAVIFFIKRPFVRRKTHEKHRFRIQAGAAIKRVDAGFSTAQEETAQMTGGDYNRNIKLRVTEAKRKREVDEIGKAQTVGE